ncbi:MAG: putative bifunctional diguanylate cyclase/phosphodiesterase [Jatrophihabitantaceae bacterium]
MRRAAEYRLGWLVWAVMAAGVGIDLAVTGVRAQPNRVAVLVFCVVFFGILLLRLALAMRAQTSRRYSLGILMFGVLLWAGESSILQTAQQGDHGQHLAEGELAYLLTYLVFVVYLLVDGERRPARAVSTWMETAVVSGGSASLAGTLLLTPLAAETPDAVSLLVALVYPVADVMLALLVIAQISLHMRSPNRASAQLCLGFVLLAVADASFVSNVLHGSDGSSVLAIVLWGAGFAQLVSAACRRPVAGAVQGFGEVPAPILIAATVAAIGVLVFRPDGGVGIYLTAPAVLTLLAAGARLLVALREAKGAAQAFADARTDDLTKLPNRRAMLARIDEELSAGRPLALMLMDLNGFKDINDSLGHAAGDVILQLSGSRMRAALPAKVMVARLGGDEFALVVPDEDGLTLMETANLALAAVREPAIAHGIELVVGASVGIAIREPDDLESSALLRRADVAMYQAKTSGAGAVIYEADRDDFSRDRLRMVEELRRAMADGQLVLWYQPQIEAATQEVCGLEALVRWNHPTRGLLPPAEFLPVARHAGLMPALSDAVIRHAASDMRKWAVVGRLRICVALNCPPPELLSGTFVRRLRGAIDEYGLDTANFMVEVTEDSFLADPERARDIVLDIRDQGLKISIDDYGTGFSSLAYLRDLPIDELKMDRSFVMTMTADRRSRMIVESTVKMAHALELRVVAEGVEDASTAAMLVAMGADTVQGYHFARPMPADQVVAWVKSWGAGLAEIPRLSGDRHGG